MLTSHYFSSLAKWVTNAEALIVSVISGPRKDISELQTFLEQSTHTPIMLRHDCRFLIFNLDQDKRDRLTDSMYDGEWHVLPLKERASNSGESSKLCKQGIPILWPMGHLD